MILPVLAWIGLFSMLAQVLLMRELLVTFEGNELSLGIVLAAWLIGTGSGSGLSTLLLSRRKPEGRRLLAGSLVVAGLAFPLTLAAARMIRPLLQETRGELAGPDSLLYAFLVLLPLCFSLGTLFPAGTLALSEARFDATRAAGRVYLLEALGAGAGGILAAVLPNATPPLPIGILAGLVNLMAAGSLLARRRWLPALVCVGVAPFLVVSVGSWAERATLGSAWKGYDLVDSSSSPYGKLAVVESEGERVVFHNGVVLFGASDEQAIEESIHYPLLEHPAPRQVLLIGGGSPSALATALKHSPVEHLDYVEADPALLDLFKRHFRAEWEKLASDSRLQIHQSDARRFIRGAGRRWDVIIVGLPPPRTILMNRYYTYEFLTEVRAALSPSGIVALQLPGSANYISDELGRFLACIRKTVSLAFPHIVALPGPTVQFFGSAGGPGSVTRDPVVLMDRVRARRLESLYVRDFLIPFRLSADRVSDLDKQTQVSNDTPVNRDFAPVAYYLDFIVWGSIFGEGYRRLFGSFARVPYWIVCLLAGIFATVPVLFAMVFRDRRKRNRLARSISVQVSVGAMGLTMLGLQVILLLGFQASYGFLYQQLALLIGAFMFGMSFGARLGLRVQRASLVVPRLQILVCVWLAVVYLSFSLAAKSESVVLPYLLFTVLSLLTGMVGGWHFCAALDTWARGRDGASGLGWVYAIDLVGSAVGAVAVAAYLLPVFGYAGTAGVLVVVNLVAAAVFCGVLGTLGTEGTEGT
ncbi:MAG: hypothetical protein EHM61_18480 [Acidobacteria bacterium]|nr:MAG: hypothetical protein EHM61_18480 [Acidobacteriota bacterium]